MAIIYHVTSKEEWEEGKRKGAYVAGSLEKEGFIHCSEEHQVKGVLERYFRARTGLVKLIIDTTRLSSRLQYDHSASVNEAFPHIYGPINLDAVIGEEVIG
jgi:uncharacterized protein (DUF952 family)